MLTVTLQARDRLLTKLAAKDARGDQTLRMAKRPGGWRLRLDRPRPEDTAIIHDGRTVLVLDEAVSSAMTDRLLDVESTEAGPRLQLLRVPDGHA